MLRMASAALLVLLQSSLLAAQADVFTKQERAQIIAFQTDAQPVDPAILSAKLADESAFQSSSTDNVLGAIVALQSGDNDAARRFSQRAIELASSDAQRVHAGLLDAFVSFYLAPASERSALEDALVNSVGLFEEAGFEVDWLSGKAIEMLSLHADHSSDPALSKQAADLAEKLMRDRKDFRARAWLINLYFNGAYTTALKIDAPSHVSPQEFLQSAVQEIYDAQLEMNDGEELELLRRLYYRAHTIDGAATSRAASRGEEASDKSIGMIERFHPDFQNDCIEDFRNIKKAVRTRREFGTGGTLIRIRVNEKGRAKFVETVDAQPARLMGDFMHVYLKRLASGMRIDIKKDKPECAKGGEMIIPYNLSWGR